jgi:hypothetical protein
MRTTSVLIVRTSSTKRKHQFSFNRGNHTLFEKEVALLQVDLDRLASACAYQEKKIARYFPLYSTL